MPCGKGCGGCGAALSPLGWERLVPCPVSMAFAGVSQRASQCDLLTDLGCFLLAAAVSPVWFPGGTSQSAESLIPREAA